MTNLGSLLDQRIICSISLKFYIVLSDLRYVSRDSLRTLIFQVPDSKNSVFDKIINRTGLFLNQFKNLNFDEGNFVYHWYIVFTFFSFCILCPIFIVIKNIIVKLYHWFFLYFPFVLTSFKFLYTSLCILAKNHTFFPPCIIIFFLETKNWILRCNSYKCLCILISVALCKYPFYFSKTR